MMAESVMCKPCVEEATDDSTSSISSGEGSPVLKKAKVCTDSPSPVEETADEKMDGDEGQDDDNEDYEDESADSDDDFRTYWRHICDTEGFYVDMNLRPGSRFGVITPIYFEDDVRPSSQWAKMAVGIAVDRYNADPQVSSKLELIKIIRANRCKTMFYITFKARSISHGDVQTYQTKVSYVPLTDDPDLDCEVFIFRPEPECFKKYIQVGDQPCEDGDACVI